LENVFEGRMKEGSRSRRSDTPNNTRIGNYLMTVTAGTWENYVLKHIKRTVIGSVLVGLGAMGAASAADMAVKARPMPAPIYSWTGFYIGVNGGYGWGRTTENDNLAGTMTTHNPSGGLAGGQIGYNWQMAAWVFGLEADGDWANIRGAAPCPNPAFNCTSNTRDLASFRGRIGYAVGPALFYGTGGLGYANTHYATLTFATNAAAPGSTGLYNTDRWGYALGAGIEYGFTPNWTAKVEYMHYGFDASTAPIGTLAPAAPIVLGLRIDTIKAGLNYRFGGPVVAKY
jgi:outer membrane immunogenic protein